jgi:hypothetical protein
MKILWCGVVMALFDEDEFAAVVNLLHKTFAQVRHKHQVLCCV